MLTPLDIQNKIFKKDLRGYSTQQVDEFLNVVIANYEALFKENRDLSDKIKELGDTVSKYKNIEETLQNTLVAAQDAAEQLKRNASDRAENIIKAAQNKSDDIVREAHLEVQKLNKKYEDLKFNMDIFRSNMVSLLDSQQKLLKGIKVPDKTLREITDPDLEEESSEISEDIMAALESEDK